MIKIPSRWDRFILTIMLETIAVFCFVTAYAEGYIQLETMSDKILLVFMLVLGFFFFGIGIGVSLPLDYEREE